MWSELLICFARLSGQLGCRFRGLIFFLISRLAIQAVRLRFFRLAGRACSFTHGAFWSMSVRAGF